MKYLILLAVRYWGPNNHLLKLHYMDATMTTISISVTFENKSQTSETEIDVEISDEEFPLVVALYNDGFTLDYYECCETILDSDIEVLANLYDRINQRVKAEFKDEIAGGNVSYSWPFNACLDMDNAEQINTPEDVSRLPKDLQSLFNKWNKSISDFKQKGTTVETKYRSETHIDFVYNMGLYSIHLSAFGANQEYYDLIRDTIENDLRDLDCRYVYRDDWQDLSF